MNQTTTPQDQRLAGAVDGLAVQRPGMTLPLMPNRAPTAMKQLAGVHTAADLLRWNETLVHFWLEQANQHVAATAQTQRRLAGARGWRERLDIHGTFANDSLSWLRVGMVCQAAVTRAMVARARLEIMD